MRRMVPGTARKLGLWCGALAFGVAGCFGQSPAQWAPPDQALQYAANTPKTILELQQFRRTTSRAIEDSAGGAARLPSLS